MHLEPPALAPEATDHYLKISAILQPCNQLPIIQGAGSLWMDVAALELRLTAQPQAVADIKLALAIDSWPCTHPRGVRPPSADKSKAKADDTDISAELLPRHTDVDAGSEHLNSNLKSSQLMSDVGCFRSARSSSSLLDLGNANLAAIELW